MVEWLNVHHYPFSGSSTSFQIRLSEGTNLIKLAGLILGIREVLTTRNTGVMVFCGIMMSGAQGLEQVAITFIDRFFGGGK